MAHGQSRSADQLDNDFASAVAATMQALATASRVRILGQLRRSEMGVNDLAEKVGMEPSAVSHQLRILRHLGFVVARREGRRVFYDLHDDHVGALLDEAISHVEHVELAQPARKRSDFPRPAKASRGHLRGARG